MKSLTVAASILLLCFFNQGIFAVDHTCGENGYTCVKMITLNADVPANCDCCPYNNGPDYVSWNDGSAHMSGDDAYYESNHCGGKQYSFGAPVSQGSLEPNKQRTGVMWMEATGCKCEETGCNCVGTDSLTKNFIIHRQWESELISTTTPDILILKTSAADIQQNQNFSFSVSGEVTISVAGSFTGGIKGEAISGALGVTVTGSKSWTWENGTSYSYSPDDLGKYIAGYGQAQFFRYNLKCQKFGCDGLDGAPESVIVESVMADLVPVATFRIRYDFQGLLGEQENQDKWSGGLMNLI
ncbi:hypothetical protein JXA32_11250 [Candidatus Sumerlaeota bacterium]|nr:hypothetical protein [Candidatus Sumerlaeota bacterium]